VSDWAFLTETLGEAGLVYRSRAELIDLIEAISPPDLERAGAVSRSLQPALSWSAIANELFATMVAAGAFKG
jgi:hypothetical protein